jgi:hypothetical protein
MQQLLLIIITGEGRPVITASREREFTIVLVENCNKKKLQYDCSWRGHPFIT